MLRYKRLPHDVFSDTLIAGTPSRQGNISKESLDSTLSAYNNSCSEMRSKARDAYIRDIIE
jgi:hypothetical protein